MLFMGQQYFGDFKQDFAKYHCDGELKTLNYSYKVKN